jgi:transmembrane sensor
MMCRNRSWKPGLILQRIIEHFFLTLTSEIHLQVKLDQYRKGDLDAVWDKTLALVNQHNPHPVISPEKNDVFKLWLKIASVAAILIMVVTGLWFYTSRQKIFNRQSDIVNQNDIAPGKNTATVTFANGKTIKLSETKTGVKIDDSRLIYTDGTTIIDTSSLHIATISTPRGGTYQVMLSDGTVIWLNAASSLKLPSTFAGLAKRRVELIEGEAYFEVAKDKKHPFIVSSKGQEVEVLGTHFNINSYADELSVKTTLLEGRVRVNNMILKPDQQSVLTKNSLILKEVDVADEVAWKYGKFSFNEEELNVIMKKIERWYDVKVDYEDDLRNVKFSGSISRFTSISKVLGLLETTGRVHFEIEGNKIVVMK